MDGRTLVPFPIDPAESIEHDLREIDAAIALVARGFATRVCLVGLIHLEAAAAIGLAHAQLADVSFHLERGPETGASVTLGPRNRVTEDAKHRSNA